MPTPDLPFYFLSYETATLGPSYRWSQAVFNFWLLANFTGHDALKIHLCCSPCQNLLPS